MEVKSQLKREDRFVQFVLDLVKREKGARAALRRADHETTEYQSWEYLSRWCDLEKGGERKAFGIVAASLARSVPDRDGNIGLGHAIALAYSGEYQRSEETQAPAKARLRRLLACKSMEEVVLVSRSVLKLLESRGVMISYSKLLRDFIFFDNFQDRVKTRWAQDFYGKMEEK